MRRSLYPRRRSIVVHSKGLVLMAALLTVSASAVAQQTTRASDDRPAAVPGSPIEQFVAEASVRFGMPERWIRAIMQAESAGNPHAVSRAGAMGLMQIMPATWTELRARYGLGSDPFNPRDNILAGTAYMREMYDRFGAPGFLAAYNAGPGRYAEHLRTGRTLPRETRRYVAALSQELGFSDAAPLQPVRTVSADRWQIAPLFAPVSASREPQRTAERDRTSASVPTTEEPNLPGSQNSQPNPLFVSRTGEPDR